MSYAALQMIHVTSVALSYLLFTLRGIWMVQSSDLLQRRWVKIVPHMIDTVLLTSAIGLAVTLHQSPIKDPWLGAKVAGLLLYIWLGMIALKRGKTRKIKVTALVAAHVTFFYIVLVALTKNPLPL
ncbi:MAG: hypothetical protein JW384_00370 [Nitrosomonadaceae bacterium]|jgi:uncharacterized membrane protein SirB2|nr:SirB2 family protein [Nitrosospira sp.]MCG3769249.1 hypothetical protein [Nitrosomonadaceae bacterium]MBI0408854.1 SirB2 family protein [Nitrosospira sp.]MBI0411048.1 SirB2 family protein [Nitrosospira sp.]MBI0412526.1 SirB2 family protein [Nitrosospira sp.]